MQHSYPLPSSQYPIPTRRTSHDVRFPSTPTPFLQPRRTSADAVSQPRRHGTVSSPLYKVTARRSSTGSLFAFFLPRCSCPRVECLPVSFDVVLPFLSVRLRPAPLVREVRGRSRAVGTKWRVVRVKTLVLGEVWDGFEGLAVFDVRGEMAPGPGRGGVWCCGRSACENEFAGDGVQRDIYSML